MPQCTVGTGRLNGILFRLYLTMANPTFPQKIRQKFKQLSFPVGMDGHSLKRHFFHLKFVSFCVEAQESC